MSVKNIITNVEYDNLFDALSSVDYDDENKKYYLCLESDYSIDKILEVKTNNNKTVELDLNNHNLDINVENGLTVYSISNFDIKNGNILCNRPNPILVKKYSNYTGGLSLINVNVIDDSENCFCLTIDGDGSSAFLSQHSSIQSNNNTPVCIKSGTFISYGTIKSMSDNPCIELKNSKSTLEIHRGELTTNGPSCIVSNQLKKNFTRTIRIYGGVFESVGENIVYSGSGNHIIDINGGIFSDANLKISPEYNLESKEEILEHNLNDTKNEIKFNGKSINLNIPLSIYKSPNRKTLYSKILGAITILNDDIINPNTNESFSYVKYKLQGVGGYGYGYISNNDLIGGLST